MSRALLLAVALVAGAAAAQEPVAFAVTDATRALADGAPAVVRHYETEYDVDSPGRATTRVRLVSTAFSPAGRAFVGQMRVVHGGFRQLRSLEGTLRDADGRVVRTLGRRDAEDALLGSIYEDLRIRSAELYGDDYPFTIEWTYEIEHRGVLGWPTWHPQPEGRPVETSRFRLSVPAGTLVRSRLRHLADAGVTLGERGRDRYSWSTGQRPALVPEPFGPPWWEQVPELRLGTDRFEIGGASGRLDSWEAFGAWYGGLGEGKQVLPERAREEVHRVIAGATSDREKAARLYRHLQETTRYVSIQLGLGGWQPYDAAYVFERRYGDCKALTNYLQAILAEAGIASEPVLIEAGDAGSDLDPDFPDNGFNHVVLRLPMDGEEAVWLESTSSYAAFGHLGSFTEGRPGLLVRPDGGEIVHTPVSPSSVNRTVRTATARLDARGGATADVSWVMGGDPRADALAALDGATAAERSVVFQRATGLGSLTIMDVDLADVAARPEEIRLGATLQLPHAARRAGNRLLVGLVPFAPAPPALPEADTRTQPLRLGTARLQRDSVRFVVPEGYVAGDVPEPVEIEAAVGRYRLDVRPEAGAIVVVRELDVSAPSLPAEAYDETRSFFESVARADGARVVLRAADG